MRRIILLAPALVAACSGDSGALIILHGDVAATEIEVVLASPAQAERLEVAQHTQPDDLDAHMVTYFRQRSTSAPIALGGAPTEGFAIRLQADPSPETFIPFALAYDANHVLVGAGRIGRGEPAAIEIPSGRLLRHDVELQAITANPPAKDVVDGVGGLVVCSRDQAITGAVFKLAGMAEQVRLAFPTTWSPYDLDCDDHDVEFQNDCNDLSTLFNPDELTETCDSLDFNCDHMATDSTTSCVVVDPNDPANTGCIGASSCNTAGACVPITADGACRCIVDVCEVATCSIAFTNTGAGSFDPCAPAGAGLHLCSDAEKPCKFKIRSQPLPGVAVDLGSRDAVGTIVYESTVTVTDASTVVLLRATPVPNLGLTAGHVFGEVEVERVSASGTIHLLLTIGMDADASPQCVPNSFDPSTSTMVCQ